MDMFLTLLLSVLPVILVPLLGLLATPAGLPLLSWLIGNPIGRVIILLAIAAAGVWIAWRMGQRDGVSRIEAQMRQRNLDALREQVVVNEKIRQMTPEQRREELSKWVR